MRWDRYLLPTYKEDPKEVVNISQKFLMRGGFIKQHQAGVFIFLPLGFRVLRKITEIIREEMERIGGQELLMPSLTTKEIWMESGRWLDFGDDIFKLKDRKGREMALAPTHEELFSEIAKENIKSYRDLPQIWFQIQTKFRDELRPRGGLLRVREFIMKDSYSFDRDYEGLDVSYNLHKEAYIRIFKRCGLKFIVTEASSGVMGGTGSEEFMTLVESGEDKVIVCENCGYTANVEVAKAKPYLEKFSINYNNLKEVHTPNMRSVEEVSEFLGVKPYQLLKSILYVSGNKRVLALIRGDYEINENKLKSILKDYPELRMATFDEALEWYNVELGFIGPCGIDVDLVISDETVAYSSGFVCGANKKDYHLIGVEPYKHFRVDIVADIREVSEGDLCKNCGNPLTLKRGIELGHIFKLGTKYSESMNVYFQDKDGKLKPVVMGSYGIGLGRIMAASCEIYNDKDGLIWPISIAPFEISLLELDTKKHRGISQKIYENLIAKGLDVIWDDRNISPGTKFKDNDLIGFPIQVIAGNKLEKNLVELKIRKDNNRLDVTLGDLETKLKEIRGKLYEELGS